MIKTFQLTVSPELGYDFDKLKEHVRQQLKAEKEEFKGLKVVKRSIDARSRQVKIYITVEAYLGEPVKETIYRKIEKNVSNAKPVIIVGAGPAGLFAALKLIELGLKPVIFERGKNVRDRRRDLAAINKDKIVNPESNYCFGEGGAGTYSDGKLYTRSNKRGDIQSILETFVAHGASEEILIEAHPHIGTNKLPNIITDMRETILRNGGEIHFNSKVIDFIIQNNHIKGVKLHNGDSFLADNLILATGHSARDIFDIFRQKNILIEAKPFAMGVRAEHQQSLIDASQYHCENRGEYLPPASYSLVQQIGDRGVYSFCMCPGGIIAPCATDIEEVVTNGWSPSKRNNPYANSGIVVGIELEDLKPFEKFGAFAGLEFQKSLEKAAWIAGGKTLEAPAQRIVDFTKNKVSANLPSCSYHPGIVSAPLHEVLPKKISHSLQQAFIAFGNKMKGYYSNEAIIVGVESRTSSPIRIPREKESLEHVQIKGLYPCAEGAGYAGGIVSAAMDGIKCAEKIYAKSII